MRQKNKLLPLFFTAGIIFLFAASDCFCQQEAEISPEDKIKKSREYHLAGKKLLEQGNYTGANESFKKAQFLLTGTSDIPVSAADIPDAPQNLPAQTKAERALPNTAIEKPENTLLPTSLAFYTKAIEAAPQNPNLYYNLAMLYLKAREYKIAAEFLKKVIQLRPKDTDAYYNLGVLYESYLKDKSMALTYYNRYLKFISPKEAGNEVREWVRQIKKELETK